MKKILVLTAVMLLSFFEYSNAATTGAGQSMNPDISVILDGYIYVDSFKNSAGEAVNEDLGHLYEEIAGFGSACHHEEGEEHQHGPMDGFNLNHAEINLSGNVDMYFKAYAIAAISPEGAELEVAQIETLSLPLGLKVKTGKFFSDFGRLNPQHNHQWDFVTAPLVNRLFFGTHGINDIGLQVAWLAPAPFYLEIGAEGFEKGGEENSFAYLGGDQVPVFNSPRAGVGWIKVSPDLGEAHSIMIGASYINGVRQEAHDGNDDSTEDHWLSGWVQFVGMDFVYKYDSTASYGQGDLVVQGEYYIRDSSLMVYRHDLNAALEGRFLVNKQDGLYLQATYGFLPRWRVGARYDHLGAYNYTTTPTGAESGMAPTNRVTAMVDFSLTEFSRLRGEAAYGEYELADEGKVSGFSGGLQIDVSLGTHGAHAY